MYGLTDILYYLLPVLLTVLAMLYYHNQQQLKLARQHAQQASMQSSSRKPEVASNDRIFTLAELAQYDGSNPTSAVLLGCKGLVFDMTPGESFYGPGGPYAAFAGKDASRSLAKMDMSYSSADIRDLKPSEHSVLQEWYDKYQMKYNVVGKIMDHSEPNSGEAPKAGWTQPLPAAAEKKNETASAKPAAPATAAKSPTATTASS